MTYFVRITVLLSMVLFINGCASLSKKECLNGNWQQIGLQDAKDGYNAKPQLGRHNDACGEYNIRPNNKQYYAGYTEGLTLFCTRKNGFHIGANANQYRGICPASLKSEFLRGYLSGLDVAINHNFNEIRELRYERREKRRKLHRLENRSKKSKKHKERIKHLRSSISSIRSQISSERSEISQLEGWQRLWEK